MSVLSVVGKVAGGVLGLFTGKGLIDLYNKAERKAALGVFWFLVLAGGGAAAFGILKGLAALVK